MLDKQIPNVWQCLIIWPDTCSYASLPDSKSPVHISLNATATSTNQISIRWHLHASEHHNIPPIPQLSIQIRNLKDAAKTFDDVTNTTAEKYILNDLEKGTDYSVCLMAKNEKRIVGEDCVNVTTFSSSPPGKKHIVTEITFFQVPLGLSGRFRVDRKSSFSHFDYSINFIGHPAFPASWLVFETQYRRRFFCDSCSYAEENNGNKLRIEMRYSTACF